MLGDFNIHVNDENDNEAGIFVDTMMALGFNQHVSFPMHRAGNILDLVFTETCNSNEVKSCTPGPIFSDHTAIEIVVTQSTQCIQKRLIKYRKLRDININQLTNDLEVSDIINGPIDDMVDELESKLLQVLDKHAPEKTKMVTVRHRLPWYTDEIKEQKRRICRRERVWQKFKLESNWIALREERTQYRLMLKEARKTTWAEKIKDCGTDAKKLYTLINNLTNNNKDNPLPESQSDESLANQFAQYFMNKIKSIRDSLDSHPLYKPIRREVPTFSSFSRITEDQVEKIMRSMSSKCCELDVMPPKIMKQIIPSIITPITNLINNSLENGIFAKNWKTAIIKPLLKKAGLDLMCKNYRPVSNLSFLSKILEKCALLQFNNHCIANNLLPDYQSAYREHFSCETALVKLVDDMLWNMEEQKVTAVVAIDLSAALDTVDHDVLLDVLNNRFGLEGNTYNWIDSYLRPRKFKVNIGQSYSEEIDVKFSVPQGSIFGPVL